MGIICLNADKRLDCGVDDGLDISRGVGSTGKVTSFVLEWSFESDIWDGFGCIGAFGNGVCI